MPPAALWCAARHTFPRSLPWVPRLRTRLPLVPSSARAYSGVNRVGGLTAVRPCARSFNSAPPAPSSSSRRTPAARLPRPAPRGSPPLGPPLPLADASSGASGGASGEASERATDLPLPTVREASVDHLRPPSCRFASASLNEGSATFARRAPPAVRSVGDSTSAPSCRFRQARRLLYLRASRSPNRQVGERRGNAAAVLARPFSASG